MFNLLENAENGKTAFKVSRETVGEMDWLTFVVQDTGAGISPKVLENLFKGSADAADETLETACAESQQPLYPGYP